MAWVQVGNRKINMSLICYAEEEAETVKIWFTGSPITLEFHFDEAKELWKAIKAEAVLGGDNKGFQTIEKKQATPTYDMGHEKPLVEKTLVLEKPKPAPAPIHSAHSSQKPHPSHPSHPSHPAHSSHSSSHTSSQSTSQGSHSSRH
jgi:hypothetical protein